MDIHPLTPHLPRLLARSTPFLSTGEVDRNGDLMLLRYLLSVLRQDLRCRLEVYSAWAGCEEALQGRRHALLNGSLLWRVWTDLVRSAKCLALV